MYLTAQRVRASDGKEGINSYLFLHGDDEIPGMSWSTPDVALVADHHPGAVVVQRIEQDFGGNEVLSFLDVVARDSFGLGLEQLRAALSSTAFDPTREATWSTGPLSFRLFCSTADHRDPATEFQALREHALLLLRARGASAAPAANTPLLEVVFDDNEGLGVVYRLDEDGQRRLRQYRPQGRRARVRVAHEDRQALVALWGNDEYHRQIVLALTGLTEGELAQLGGAVIVDAGHQLTPQIEATTAELAGQVPGDWFGPGEQVEHRRGWPTGAVLRSGELALDLVYIERAWYPMSEVALYTYQHSAGLLAGEPWRFVTRAEPRTIFRVSLVPAISRQQVAENYGQDAGARCRDDRLTVQLRLTQEN